jgi:hypothetical protein
LQAAQIAVHVQLSLAPSTPCTFYWLLCRLYVLLFGDYLSWRREILSELISADLSRSTPVVAGQMFDGSEIALRGPRGEVSEL